jgi:hypothetical protein
MTFIQIGRLILRRALFIAACFSTLIATVVSSLSAAVAPACCCCQTFSSASATISGIGE